MRPSIELSARAKLNLHLFVGEPRPDGYHELETVFQSISMEDRVAIERGRPGSIVVRAPGLPGVPAEKNLAYRAARLFLDAIGAPEEGVRISIDKRIPAGAGLGGGSADAAAVLCGLGLLFGDPLDARTLSAVGLAVGSDVPFCMAGGLCGGRGRGEVLERLPAGRPLAAVVVKPAVSVATPGAYAALDAAGRPHRTTTLDAVLERLRRSGAPALAGVAMNSFEKIVFRDHPDLAGQRDSLIEAGASWAMLAGSGSSLFGVFENREAAEAAADTMRRRDHATIVEVVTGVPDGVIGS